MKAMKGVAATLALATVAWCGIAPGIIGMRSEDKLRSDFASLANTAAAPLLSLQQFDRGWFFSTARARLTLPLGGGTQSAEIRYRINQFAIPFVRWSRTDYTITPLDAEGRPLASPLPLDMHTIRGFDGSNTTSLSGHDLALGGPSAVLTFSIDGQLQSREGQPVTYDLTLPSASYQIAVQGKPDGLTLRASNIKLSGSLAANGFSADQPWASQTSQKLDSIDLLAGGMPVFHIGPIHGDAVVQDQGSNVAIRYRTHLSRLTITPPHAQALDLDNIDADFSYANLNKLALVAWQKDANQLRLQLASQNDPRALQQATGEMIRRHIGSFLAQSPSFSLDRLAMHTPHGNFSSSLLLSFNGSGTAASTITPQWLMQQGKSRVIVKAGFTLDRSLIAALAARAGTPEQVAQAQLASEANIAQWKAKGWLKDDGKQISTSLQFDASGIRANGQVVDPAAALPAMVMPPASPLPAGAAPMPPVAAAAQQGPGAAMAPPQPAAVASPQPAIALAQAPNAAAGSGQTGVPTTQPRPKPRAHARASLPGPGVDLRHCLAQQSDLAIMRCASH